jgi:hypothetical protein
VSQHRIGPEERLRVTLLFSAILHAIVILGVTFDYEDPAAYLPSLDVILVQSAAATKPDKADFLANASQQGGGESEESKRPRQPVTSPIPKRPTAWHRCNARGHPPQKRLATGAARQSTSGPARRRSTTGNARRPRSVRVN